MFFDPYLFFALHSTFQSENPCIVHCSRLNQHFRPIFELVLKCARAQTKLLQIKLKMLEVCGADCLYLLETRSQISRRVLGHLTHLLNICSHVSFDLSVLITETVDQLFLSLLKHIKAWFAHIIDLSVQSRLYFAYVPICGVNLLL